MVGVPRFELGTSSSRTKHSARLSYTPDRSLIVAVAWPSGNAWGANCRCAALRVGRTASFDTMPSLTVLISHGVS